MPASYGGSLIFGPSPRTHVGLNPPAQQINAFFGVSGLQSLFGGLRGREIVVTGVLVGSDLNDLNAAEANLASYCDGVARTLVDSRGRAWPFVLLRPAEMGDHVMQDADGRCAITFRVAGLGLL